MAKIHVTQIAGVLQQMLDGKIDMTDWKGHVDPVAPKLAYLSRALAAFSLVHLTGITPDVAGQTITDGGKDSGIDAVYFDATEKVLYLVQSKWHESGNGSIDQGSALKFINGVRHVLDADFDKFNAKLKGKAAEISKALQDASARFMLVIVHTGQDGLGVEVQSDIQKYVDSQNDTSEIMRWRVFKQADVHSAIAKGVGGAPINLDVSLIEWAQTTEPYFSVYGQASALDVSSWQEMYAPRLFAPNLRYFLGKTDVNSDIVSTLQSRPEAFWYFNNGITAICTKISKKPLGGNSRAFGVFECEGVHIVNGAQTVGAIWDASKKDADAVSKARVPVRFISLENCPQGFATEVTRFTNTQNAIEKRDFVALDVEQERISQELLIDNIRYSYKSSETKLDLATGFDLTEATVALACQNPDVSLAVQAKREISKLWEDIEKAPYKALFNAAVNGPQVWQAVQAARAIQSEISKAASDLSGRSALIAIHGNRFITWVVLQRLGWKSASVFAERAAEIPSATAKALSDLIEQVKINYSDSYPASLFKNLSKCKILGAKLV